MGHPMPSPLTWGDISFKTMAPNKVEARAWFIDAAGHGRYRRVSGPSKATAKRKLLTTLRELSLQSDGALHERNAVHCNG